MVEYQRIDGGGRTLALACDQAGEVRLVHFGPALPPNTNLADLDALQTSGPRESTPDAPPSARLVYPTDGFGWMGTPAVEGCFEDGLEAAIGWSSARTGLQDNTILIELVDNRLRLAVALSWRLDSDTGALVCSARITNNASQPFHLARVAAIHLPLPDWAGDIIAFDGDWAKEARPHRFRAPPGIWKQTDRTGRTGFRGSSFVVGDAGATFDQGRVIALHLGWSGPHTLAVETLPDGQRCASLGPRFAPGEVVIAPGSSRTTPNAYAFYSGEGLNTVSTHAHAYVRERLLPAASRLPRPVHLNTWEAVGFDVDEATLIELAGAAAAIGVERFVVDDGWFSGRANDGSALGDWRPDPTKFPNGLGPVIAAVQARGMSFGLWVEPEMVNPESDLYRRHPDWCVHAEGAARPTMRNQLWLDVSRPDVRDHIAGMLDSLLTTYPISYIKWDCNRFIFPAVSDGRPAAGAIVEGGLELMDSVRARHPAVEIEACASGGARVDFGLLSRAVRVWPSDSTDAVDRLRIQSWTGLLTPPEAMGAHVGASPNPITGRSAPMLFRARVSMFGHMGVELDPRKLPATDREMLARHIALYKQFRTLLHSGVRSTSVTTDGAVVWASCARDGVEQLVGVFRDDEAASLPSAPIRLRGLDPEARYSIELPPPWPEAARRRLTDAATWTSPRTFDGAVLLNAGLPLPVGDPLTAWLVHVRRV